MFRSITCIVLCILLSSVSLFGQNRGEREIFLIESSSNLLKSTSLDSLDVQITVQQGGGIDTTSIIGTCTGATNYQIVRDIPAEIQYITTNVTVSNLGEVVAYYNISAPASTAPGEYYATVLFTILQGTNPCILKKLKFTITVAEATAPVADFVAIPTTIIEEGTVYFEDMSKNPVTQWQWDFGDGQSSTVQNPGHSYLSAGNYTVSLTVTGPAGSDMLTKENYIEVLPKGTPGIGLWNYTTFWSVWASPVIDKNGTIYVGSLENYVYALNPDGTEKWRHLAQGSITSIVVGNDSNIYFTTLKYLYGIDNEGKRLWSHPTNGDVSDLAIGADGNIYIISSNSPNLWAISSGGESLWSLDLGWISSMPMRVSIAPDGTIYSVGYIESGNLSRLYAVSTAGNIKWTRDIQQGSGNGYRTRAAIAADGTVYIGSYNNLAAINPDGTDKWLHSEGPGFFVEEPVIGKNGDIYSVFNLSFSKSRIISHDKEGNLNWVYDVPGKPRFRSSVTVGADEMLYFTTYDSLLYAINPDGSFGWNYKFNEASPYRFSSPVINGDGHLLVGYGQNLYAISTTSSGLADSPWPKSGQNIMNTGRKINPAPYLISPENDSVGVPLSTNLSWSQIAGASGYQLELDLNGDFSSSSLYTASTANNGVGIDNLQLSTYYYWHVRASSLEGESGWSPTWRFITTNATGIENEGDIAASYSLEQNYPNPFSHKTLIRYSIPEADNVIIKVFNIAGKEILNFDEGLKPPGMHQMQMDASMFEAGVYYYKLEAEGVNLTKKLVVVK